MCQLPAGGTHHEGPSFGQIESGLVASQRSNLSPAHLTPCDRSRQPQRLGIASPFAATRSIVLTAGLFTWLGAGGWGVAARRDFCGCAGWHEGPRCKCRLHIRFVVGLRRGLTRADGYSCSSISTMPHDAKSDRPTLVRCARATCPTSSEVNGSWQLRAGFKRNTTLPLLSDFNPTSTSLHTTTHNHSPNQPPLEPSPPRHSLNQLIHSHYRQDGQGKRSLLPLPDPRNSLHFQNLVTFSVVIDVSLSAILTTAAGQVHPPRLRQHPLPV